MLGQERDMSSHVHHSRTLKASEHCIEICIVLFICGLFNDVISISENTAARRPTILIGFFVGFLSPFRIMPGEYLKIRP
jgi:hypothetical protein